MPECVDVESSCHVVRRFSVAQAIVVLSFGPDFTQSPHQTWTSSLLPSMCRSFFFMCLDIR